MNERVAVIDIGSNSIKALVAEHETDGSSIRTVFHDSREVRISKGIAGNPPILVESSMWAGVQAVVELMQGCEPHGPFLRVQIVATSAVRSAVNGLDFMNEIYRRTGIHPQTLTGEEEADGIAMGVRTDPTIGGQFDPFTVFDLGGGSLELIRFEDDKVAERISLPLGSVRLTEKFISDPVVPVPETEALALTSHVRQSILDLHFQLRPPLVGCSGGLTTWRAVRAKKLNQLMRESSAIFTLADVQEMQQQVVQKGLEHRINITGLPPERADIFPSTLLTFRVLLELSGAGEIRHSLHNLRYGLAWLALQDKKSG